MPATFRHLVVAIVLGILGSACGSRGEQSAGARVDALFAEWNKRDSPGCGVGVSRNGTIAFERGYGMANVERAVPISPSTVFDVASIAKQFTAMSILLLAQRGVLSLDDEIGKHLPAWADRQDRITIRHVLAHTAGLRDVFLLTELSAPPAAGDEINDRLLSILSRQRGVNFTPGSEFSYNNGGYNLLGGLVKRLSGQPLREFARANIFQPLGMTHSSFTGGPGTIDPEHVIGYHRDDRGLHMAPDGGVDTSGIVGNAGLSMTVRDLLTWERNFDDVRVGDPVLVREMQTAVTLTGGKASPYGLGLEVGQDRGLKTVGHGGGDRGIAAYVIRYPERQLAVAVLCNVDNLGFTVGALARQVAAVYLGDAGEASAPASAPARVSLSARELASKAGLYWDRETGTFGRVYVRDGRLMASADAGDGPGDSVELTPTGPNRFVVNGIPVVVEFEPESRGRPQVIRVSENGATSQVSERVPTGFTPTVSELQGFSGRYASVDLDVTYTVVVRGSGLVLQIPGRDEIPLQPVLRDGFYGSLVDLMRFTRNPRGVVTGLVINRATVRNLRFERVAR
jgi:CubicO group peptidase (beta-lactamase class C family)